MVRSSSSQHSTAIWWRALLLPLAVASTSLPEEALCDTYSVELQAVFEDDAVIPCSSQETTILEALIHSLVQTDAIVGLNRMIPVPPFFLAFEKFGRNSTRLSSFAEMEMDGVTQLELSLPNMAVEDHLEDLYYNGTGSSNAVAAVVPQDMEYKGDEEEQTPKETVVKDKLTPPAPIQLAEGSLRNFNGRNRRNLRYRNLMDTPSPTPAPTPTPSSSESPSDLPSYVPSPFPSDTTTVSASDAPSTVPSETPTVSASDAPSNVSRSVPSETPTLSASDAPSVVPSETPTVSTSDAPSESPTVSATPAPTPGPTAPETPAPTPSPTPSPTPGSTLVPTPLVDDSTAVDCEADWCAWFFTRPCDAIPHDLEREATEEFRAELEAFQQRVATQIERKLRKWARDTDVMCLGNSWQLKATVKRLL